MPRKTLLAQGLGFNCIAASLNEEGLPTRTGKRWHGDVINRILTRKRQSCVDSVTLPAPRPKC